MTAGSERLMAEMMERLREVETTLICLCDKSLSPPPPPPPIEPASLGEIKKLREEGLDIKIKSGLEPILAYF